MRLFPKSIGHGPGPSAKNLGESPDSARSCLIYITKDEILLHTVSVMKTRSTSCKTACSVVSCQLLKMDVILHEHV